MTTRRDSRFPNSCPRACVLRPVLRTAAPGRAGGRANGAGGPVAAEPVREPEDRLAEAVCLTEAIGLEVAFSQLVRLPRARPSTLFGSGWVEKIARIAAEEKLDAVVVDGALTPVQQRNLERAWSCKVIDRTAVILEIFALRAQTKEGRLQVELAAHSYQCSRLVRSWTHLERQRGGLGFVGGPGETQIEADRRALRQRMGRLRRALEGVKRTRGLHRAARRKVPYPVIALVGYTNAGKSTLFNRLTGADVAARDQLFATLDPTIRGAILPSGHKVVFSDTVGFISDLPHDLVAAFRATLEEVAAADLIVHVRDCADADKAGQRADVLRVLVELGLEDRLESDVVEVLNKRDLLEPGRATDLANGGGNDDSQVFISALTGEGIDDLLDLIDKRLGKARRIVEVGVPHEDGATLAWLYRHGEIMERTDDAERAWLKMGLAPADAGRVGRRPGIVVSAG